VSEKGEAFALDKLNEEHIAGKRRAAAARASWARPGSRGASMSAVLAFVYSRS
jgi:hypothetical protein